MSIGLGFEVATSYGIAAAEFLDPRGLDMEGRMQGLSWVAVWVLLFTVVVPTQPRRAVVAALASVSSVPVVVGMVMVTHATAFGTNSAQFFFGLVFPYLLVVGMAYVGARVVYGLGREVKRARDLGSYHLEEKLGQGGLGGPTPHAGATGGYQAHPALARNGRPTRCIGGRFAPVRARSAGHCSPPLAPHGGALRFRNRR